MLKLYSNYMLVVSRPYWSKISVTLWLQAVQETGAKLIQESDINTADIQNRLEQLAKSWEELKQMAENR